MLEQTANQRCPHSGQVASGRPRGVPEGGGVSDPGSQAP